jgi:hypothetical protein
MGADLKQVPGTDWFLATTFAVETAGCVGAVWKPTAEPLGFVLAACVPRAPILRRDDSQKRFTLL